MVSTCNHVQLQEVEGIRGGVCATQVAPGGLSGLVGLAGRERKHRGGVGCVWRGGGAAPGATFTLQNCVSFHLRAEQSCGCFTDSHTRTF